MEKTFWVFVICVELVASLPNLGSQAIPNFGNQPQNLAWQQLGYQYPVPNYAAQRRYEVPQVENVYASHWPQQAGSYANAHAEGSHYAQPPVYYGHPENHAVLLQHQVTPNQYVPPQVYTHPQVPQLTPTHETYAVPSNVPVHYGNNGNVQVLHETPQWLLQHYPNLLKTIKTPKTGVNPNVYPIPKPPTPYPIPPTLKKYVATAAAAAAAATAGGRPGSKPPMAKPTAIAGQPGPRSPVAKATATAKAWNRPVAHFIKTPAPPKSTPPVVNATTTPAAANVTTTPLAANVTKNPAPPAVANVTAVAGPGSPTANATATAGPGATANATATAGTRPPPQIIPPKIAKAIEDADKALNNAVNNSTAVVNALQAVIDAAKKDANAKSPEPYNANSTFPSSNPDLDNLSKVYKNSHDQVKVAYISFAAIVNKMHDLVAKIQDNAYSPPPSTAPAQPVQDSQTEPSNEENASPEANAENSDAPASSDAEPSENSESNELPDDNEEAGGSPTDDSL